MEDNAARTFRSNPPPLPSNSSASLAEVLAAATSREPPMPSASDKQAKARFIRSADSRSIIRLYLGLNKLFIHSMNAEVLGGRDAFRKRMRMFRRENGVRKGVGSWDT